MTFPGLYPEVDVDHIISRNDKKNTLQDIRCFSNGNKCNKFLLILFLQNLKIVLLPSPHIFKCYGIIFHTMMTRNRIIHKAYFLQKNHYPLIYVPEYFWILTMLSHLDGSSIFKDISISSLVSLKNFSPQ